MNPEEFYEKHQVLCALSGVLLHDLRNPLHSATLLVEAMGLRTSDIDTLRGRLRAQLAKLDALMSEAAGPIRELALEPHLAPVGLKDLLSDVAMLANAHEDNLARRMQIGTLEDLPVQVDRRLMARSILEVATRVAEELSRTLPDRTAPVVFRCTSDPTTVQLHLEGMVQPFSEDFAKTPFAIGGGGIRTALARALAQMSGATLKLQGGSTAQPAFVFGLPRAI